MKYYIRTGQDNRLEMLLRAPHPAFGDCVPIELTKEEYEQASRDLAHYRAVNGENGIALQYTAPTAQENELAAQAQNEARLRRLRRQRENECFSVINRGYLWYAQLSEEQLSQLGAWYRAWLDVTETQTVPQKPSWL